jgi:hypothetical protein
MMDTTKKGESGMNQTSLFEKLPCRVTTPMGEVYTFDGETYDPCHDQVRLSRQADAVFRIMSDGAWRTLEEIAEMVNVPTQSVSARLRDFRKPRFGGHNVKRRRRGDPSSGSFEYKLEV